MVALLKTETITADEVQKSYRALREPVVIFYGNDRTPVVKSFARSCSVFRLLARLGRQRIPIRLMIRGGDMLTPESMAALNLFLRYGRGLRWFGTAMGATYMGWDRFNEHLCLKWQPITAARRAGGPCG